MSWPSGTKAVTTNVDAGTDSVTSARGDIKQNIDNVNTIGKNLPPEQKINYYREILRQEAGDLPDINNPLDDLP